MEHVGASMHLETVNLSKEEIIAEKAASPKQRLTLEEQVRFEGGTVSMRGRAASTRRQRQTEMLRQEREANREEEEYESAEEAARRPPGGHQCLQGARASRAARRERVPQHLGETLATFES